MKISRDLRERARATTYHQRKALRRLGCNQDGVRTATLSSLIEAGLVVLSEGVPVLTQDGKEVRDALEALGWFPAEERPDWLSVRRDQRATD